jgi:hypothetical protein
VFFMRSIGRAAVAATIAVSLVGCQTKPPAAPPQMYVVKRLVAARYQTDGDPSTAKVPTAVLAGERRTVLSGAPSVSLMLGALPEGREREVTLDVPVPERLRGKSIRLVPTISGGVRVTRQEPLVVASAGEAIALRLGLDSDADAQEFVSIVGREGPAEASYSTAPLEVPPGARLRFGIGLDESGWLPAQPPISFRISAIEGETETVVFDERLEATTHPEERGWLDRDVSLERIAGHDVRLRFAAGPAGDAGPSAPFLFPVWSDPVIVAPGPAEKARRNLLLISLDTLRADHLGSYGYRRTTSPVIDGRLAGEGTLFEHAYAQFPGTAGSHMTLFTSLYSCVHQVTGGLGAHRKLRPEIHTLAELLRAQGYATAAFTEDGWVTADTGFDRGFATWVESKSPVVTLPTGQADKTFPSALSWIEHHGDAPWFLFAHTYQVHYPYTPPEGYLERVAPDHGEDRASRDAALYDGEIRYTDDLLAKFLDGLERAGAAENTLLIVISDHGEQFGEHRLFAHGNSLFDILLHVPIIMRAPGLIPAGKRVATTVGLIDMVPTVLELLGMPPIDRRQGQSLVPLLHDGTIAQPTLWGELPPRLVAARVGTNKWVIGQKTGRAQVYDLALDPGELVDRSGQFPADGGTKLLEGYHQICSILPPPTTPEGDEEIDPAVREKLKALGYTD